VTTARRRASQRRRWLRIARRLRRYVSAEYRKAQVAAVALLPALAASIEDGHITAKEWLVIVGALLLPVGVATATNAITDDETSST